MILSGTFNFLKEILNYFLESNTFQKGASLAYYAVFSMLPIIIIITSILGLIFGEQAVSGEIHSQLQGLLGTDAAMQIQNLIKNQHESYNNGLTTIIGFTTLVLSASGMFSQIHGAFNSIWNIKAKPKSGILKYLSKHLTAFLVLISAFFVILLSTVFNSFLITHSDKLHHSLQLAYLYEHLLSFVVFSIIFSLMFRFLGDAIIPWKAIVAGGIGTAVFFMLGKVGIGLYIGHSKVSTTFGSASVLALLMLWVYYTSQILFLGASFVKILSDRLGTQIQPNKNASRIEKIEVQA